MYDLNGDGFIQKEELRTLLSAVANVNSEKSPEEQRREVERLVSEIFQTYDINGDGSLSFGEFVKVKDNSGTM